MTLATYLRRLDREHEAWFCTIGAELDSLNPPPTVREILATYQIADRHHNQRATS